MKIDDRVLFEDNHLLIVNKPAGVLVQGDETGDKPLVEICKVYIKEKYGKPGDVFLGVVHRLDRPVSGVVASVAMAATGTAEWWSATALAGRVMANVVTTPQGAAAVVFVEFLGALAVWLLRRLLQGEMTGRSPGPLCV